MIRANTRGRLTGADLQLVILLLSRGSAHRRAYLERRLTNEGPDSLLDAPDLLERLLTVRRPEHRVEEFGELDDLAVLAASDQRWLAVPGALVLTDELDALGALRAEITEVGVARLLSGPDLRTHGRAVTLLPRTA